SFYTLFFLPIPPPPRSTLCPYTTLFRSCVVCGCVDSPRAACARRSARMRVSRTQLAISSTNPPARAGIQWTRKLIASSLLLGFKHDPQADEKQPAGDDEREWKPTGAFPLEECVQRRKHEDQDPNVSHHPLSPSPRCGEGRRVHM